MTLYVPDSHIAAVAFAAGFRGQDVTIAVAVALAESGGNPYAINVNVNHSVDHGLWQINDVNGDALAIGDWRDPATNARMARIVWNRQGWHGWATYDSGSYDKFMYRGTAAAAPIVSVPTYTLTRMLKLAFPYERGADVAHVQQLVGTTADGIYGPITEGYVKRWQVHHNLAADGIFGPLSAKTAGWNFVTDPHS